MFDDGDGGLFELGHQLESGIGIVEIVIGQLLALNLCRRGDAGPGRGSGIERCLLMRVLAITQGLL